MEQVGRKTANEGLNKLKRKTKLKQMKSIRTPERNGIKRKREGYANTRERKKWI